MASTQNRLNHQPTRRLDDIEVPSLIVVGAHDQPDMIESAEYLAARISDRSHVVIENAAHLPSLEQPEAFNAALREVPRQDLALTTHVSQVFPGQRRGSARHLYPLRTGGLRGTGRGS